MNGLVPVVIQDKETEKVLMLGFMNQEALNKTIAEKKVTFYSRTKDRLWTKGETSGNFLEVSEIKVDCDNDTLLIKVRPIGPVCHSGEETCFSEKNSSSANFLITLQSIIQDRKKNPLEKSYTTSLFKAGINKIAQKLGEEAVELVIASKDPDKDLFLGEAADLLFHYLVLLEEYGVNLCEVTDQLRLRHKK